MDTDSHRYGRKFTNFICVDRCPSVANTFGCGHGAALGPLCLCGSKKISYSSIAAPPHPRVSASSAVQSRVASARQFDFHFSRNAGTSRNLPIEQPADSPHAVRSPRPSLLSVFAPLRDNCLVEASTAKGITQRRKSRSRLPGGTFPTGSRKPKPRCRAGRCRGYFGRPACVRDLHTRSRPAGGTYNTRHREKTILILKWARFERQRSQHDLRGPRERRVPAAGPQPKAEVGAGRIHEGLSTASHRAAAPRVPVHLPFPGPRDTRKSRSPGRGETCRAAVDRHLRRRCALHPDR